MHPTDVDPGVTLAGRYRVAELLAETPGDGGVAQTWRAVDEVLSRSVVLHVLAADDPRADYLLEASRKAATASDVRFLRVLDALRDDGVAYVVREWVAGRSLGTVLADGPLPPHQAGLLVREVAEAMARAHDQGLTHERLDPDSIVVTDSGSLKIVGLATQAALTSNGAGGGSEDSGSEGSGAEGEPVRLDSLGLGRLLYAGLTARWPTGPRSGLSAAPRAADGSLLSPRQCRAGVPRPLDEITERILVDHPRSGSPLASAREIATALTDVVGVTPIEGLLPPSGSAGPDAFGGAVEPRRSRYADEPTQVGGRPVDMDPGVPNGAMPMEGRDRTGSFPADRGAPAGYGRRDDDVHSAYRPAGAYAPVRQHRGYAPSPRPTNPRWRRLAGVFVGIVLLAGTGLLGWQLMSQAFGPTDPGPSAAPDSSPSKTGKPANVKIRVVAAKDFDPPPGGNGEEHPEEVANAHDGDPGTSWTTMAYFDDPLTSYKPGVGIWFDLGKAQDLASVRLSLVPGGTDLQLLAAPKDASGPPATVDGWDPVASTKGADRQVTLKPKNDVSTRYVLVWMTRLPPDGGEYRGGIAEIVVRR
ncbi:MAG: protein kinase family protein [Actinopolymorphaceae bacterium]